MPTLQEYKKAEKKLKEERTKKLAELDPSIQKLKKSRKK